MTTWVFEVWQDGTCVASGCGPDFKRVSSEAQHYMGQYGQDGECGSFVCEERNEKSMRDSLLKRCPHLGAKL